MDYKHIVHNLTLSIMVFGVSCLLFGGGSFYYLRYRYNNNVSRYKELINANNTYRIKINNMLAFQSKMNEVESLILNNDKYANIVPVDYIHDLLQALSPMYRPNSLKLHFKSLKLIQSYDIEKKDIEYSNAIFHLEINAADDGLVCDLLDNLALTMPGKVMVSEFNIGKINIAGSDVARARVTFDWDILSVISESQELPNDNFNLSNEGNE